MRIIRPPRIIDGQTLIPTAFLQNQSIGAEAKLVYTSLASRDQAGEPMPDLATIAKETGLALHHVEAAITDLERISDNDWKQMGL